MQQGSSLPQQGRALQRDLLVYYLLCRASHAPPWTFLPQQVLASPHLAWAYSLATYLGRSIARLSSFALAVFDVEKPLLLETCQLRFMSCVQRHGLHTKAHSLGLLALQACI